MGGVADVAGCMTLMQVLSGGGEMRLGYHVCLSSPEPAQLCVVVACKESEGKGSGDCAVTCPRAACIRESHTGDSRTRASTHPLAELSPACTQ